MEIRRTANAGVLLKLDGVSILLDGVSQVVEPYLATPPDIRESLLASPPDALVFTHTHNDHYGPVFVDEYKASANGVIIGPEISSDKDIDLGAIQIGSVSVSPVRSRHIGKYGTISHYSYIIQGSKCIWFMGDASPLGWHKNANYPRPDIVIAPYAYGNTTSSWRSTKALGAENVILFHLPAKENDPYELWDAVKSVTANEQETKLWIPDIGQTIVF